MFYEGDLQSGIAKAVQESKLVVCFVTDDGEESQLWETDFLQDHNIKSLLPVQAVVLRLKAGSQEAGYLAAIFPLPKTPTVVVIRNGELKEYLVSGVTKEQFTSRIIRALETSPSVASNTTTSPSSSLPIQSSPAVQDLLAERRARLDVHKKEQEAREKAKKEAEARKRREEFEAAAAKDPKPSADAKHAVQIKKQQQQARDDRARILKRVEDDKAERREREAERKRQVAATKSLEDVAKPGVMESSTKRSSSECALQIRLFDGSTIRSRFPSHGSLSTHVRPWIKEKQEGDTPFNFKQVLTPLPNKTIETSEEEKSLQSLGLTPNATLILVPISTYTSAYQPSNIISSSLSTGYGLLSSGFGAVGGLLGSVLGGGATTPTEDQRNHGTSSGSGSTTLRTAKVEKHDQDNRQYYNGNSTNFEPRKDDGDQKKQD